MDKTALEALVRQVLLERLGGGTHGVKAVQVPRIAVTEEHRMDTGNPLDRVYTRDLFTLQESPRLGVGVMEMTDTTFPWTLRYDEMDYVLSGRLDIRIGGETVSAGPGELIYIPKNSSIQGSVKNSMDMEWVSAVSEVKSLCSLIGARAADSGRAAIGRPLFLHNLNGAHRKRTPFLHPRSYTGGQTEVPLLWIMGYGRCFQSSSSWPWRSRANGRWSR